MVFNGRFINSVLIINILNYMITKKEAMENLISGILIVVIFSLLIIVLS